MSKIIKNSNKDNLNSIKMRIINEIKDTVTSTLGPSGKPVLINQGYGTPKMTKDGVTVARNIEYADAVENTIATFFKTAANHTVDQAGDGTTTSILLAASIYEKAMKGVAVGANSVSVKNGIEKALPIVDKALNDLKVIIANDLKKIEHVAVVSANGDEKVGKLIANAFETIGPNGIITVEEGKSREHELKLVMGMQFDRGYISSGFVTNTEKMTVELENCLILIYDKKISSIQSIINVLQIIKEKNRSLLIIAEDIDGEALAGIILNKMRGVIQVAAVKAPGYGQNRLDTLHDIALSTGGTFISEELGYKLENVTLEQLGEAKKIIINANETTIVEGKRNDNDAFDSRVEQLRNAIIEASSKSEYEKEQLEQRLAKLISGIAVIKVGGATEEAAKECKDRVDDAVQAVKAAVAEGIIPGGTVSLLHAYNALYENINSIESADEKIGYEAVMNSMKEPLKKILENSGSNEFALVFDNIQKGRIKDKNFGLDVRRNEYGDLIAKGIVDPLKVVRCAIVNAATTASMLVVSEVLIANAPEKENDTNNSMNGMY